MVKIIYYICFNMCFYIMNNELNAFFVINQSFMIYCVFLINYKNIKTLFYSLINCS
ncbi:hypothetical protein C8N37_102324 [Sphingobacterium faecium]|nr:hypothetical protein C8N37_102324 [Sphingobacterium faecium]